MDTKSFEAFDAKNYEGFTVPARIERDLQTIAGIITGIGCDKIINNIERKAIADWVEKMKAYERTEPYRSILKALAEALYDNQLDKEEIDDIVWICNQYVEHINYYDMMTSGIQKLNGIVEGIAVDHTINETELNYLLQWMEENENLQNCWPYDELYSFVMCVMKDNVVSQKEHDDLLAYCHAIVGNENSSSNTALTDVLQKGFCQVDPKISLIEKTFCITGNSKKYRRREIAEKIELHGGFVTNSVSKNLNYLVVCDEKNNCWAYTCYGRKIEQTVMLRKMGANTAIVHEFDLYDAIASMA